MQMKRAFIHVRGSLPLWSPTGEPKPQRPSGHKGCGQTCLVQEDATGIAVLKPTGVALFGTHNTGHAALLLQVGHTAVLLSCPAIEVPSAPSEHSSHPPRERNQGLEKGCPYEQGNADDRCIGKASTPPPLSHMGLFLLN